MSGIPARLLVIFLLFLPLLPASADVVELENGNVLEGRVTVLADGRYRVFVEEGHSVTVSGDSVVRHVTKEAPIDEFQRRFVDVDPKDHGELTELAAWAEGHGLRRATLKAYRLILRIDPHHANARDRLGYALFENRWVKREALEARGLVRFRGTWMTAKERERERTRVAIEEFRALIADAHGDNRYLLENAVERLGENKDERIIAYMVERLEKGRALERMICAQVLANHDFDRSGEVLYQAYLKEQRDEPLKVMHAVLRRYGDGRLGQWIARDMKAWDGSDAMALRRLLDLLRTCPHKDAVTPLIELLEVRAFRTLAEDLLAHFFDNRAMTRDQWSDWWKANQDDMAKDLGSGWIKESP